MLSIVKYLIYKTINYIYLKIFTFSEGDGLKYEYRNINLNESVFFDFTHNTTHLGDRLFCFEIIYELHRKGYKLKISNLDYLTLNMAREILNINLEQVINPSKGDVIIYPAPSFLHLRKKYVNSLLLDFNDIKCETFLSKQIVISFFNFFNLKKMEGDFSTNIKINTRNFKFLESNIQYYLFSNYIGSGKFRKLFINEGKLIEKAIALKKQGYKILHIGSIQDKHKDKKSYFFIDKDLRGEISIIELINIVQSEKILGSVCYDNFLMHLTGIYGKSSFVLFRGRFFNKNYIHHMLHVNNTFFTNGDNLHYL
jgi:hypothetical protein